MPGEFGLPQIVIRREISDHLHNLRVVGLGLSYCELSGVEHSRKFDVFLDLLEDVLGSLGVFLVLVGVFVHVEGAHGVDKAFNSLVELFLFLLHFLGHRLSELLQFHILGFNRLLDLLRKSIHQPFVTLLDAGELVLEDVANVVDAHAFVDVLLPLFDLGSNVHDVLFGVCQLLNRRRLSGDA